MNQPSEPNQDPSPNTPDESVDDHTRSLRLAYGDVTSEGSRYAAQQFRPDPHQGGGPDAEEGYYEALSASTVPPSEQEGAVSPSADILGVERSDGELVDAVIDVLSLNDGIDATQIQVECKAGVVTLHGQALDRATKRSADDVAYGVVGVKDVMNCIACT